MNKFRLCYISRCYNGKASAGNKAKSDYEKILESLGAVNIALKRRESHNKIYAFFLNLIGFIKYTFSIRKNDILVLQYPVKKYFSLICYIAHKKGATVVTFIHDLGSQRRKKLTVEKEVNRLNLSNYIIAANDSMKDWLIQNNVIGKIIPMGLHDYLTDIVKEPRISEKSDPTFKIIYAGSIAKRKTSYLVELSNKDLDYQLHLYGDVQRVNLPENKNIILNDYMPSEKFIDSIEGDFGEYLKLNTPHKCSFYLVSGLPLIIWSGAAVAKIVEKEKIGLTIDSMEKLPQVLNNLTSSEIAEFQLNVKRVATQIRSGENFKNAITQVINHITEFTP